MQKAKVNMKEKKMMLPFKSRSQSLQDVFAFLVCKNKTYIEIGGNHPAKKNNTLNLENNGFQGYSIEFDKKWELDWQSSTRSNPCFFANALDFDYATNNNNLQLPKHIGYLSCDIEPPKNTYSALVKVIEQGISFDCITFEHDAYKSKDDYNQLAQDFLSNHGYKVAVTNVYHKENVDRFYETWFVKDSIDFTSIDYHTWKQSFKN